MSTFISLNSSKMSRTHDCELHAMNGKDNAIKMAIVGHIFILTINVMAFSSQCMNSKKKKYKATNNVSVHISFNHDIKTVYHKQF